METDHRKTAQELKITCYDTDVAHFLKPGAFMDLAQEIAYVSAGRLGFGYDDLQRLGLAWVLSRIHVEFPAMPRWNDVVRLETWHKGFSGPFYVRDFRMTGSDGRPAVLATSSWLIIDVASRRLLRREHVADRLRGRQMLHELRVGVLAVPFVEHGGETFPGTAGGGTLGGTFFIRHCSARPR